MLNRGVVFCVLCCFDLSAMHKNPTSSPNIEINKTTDDDTQEHNLDEERRKQLERSYRHSGLHLYFPNKFNLVLDLALESEGYVSSIGKELSKTLTEELIRDEDKAFILFQKLLEQRKLQWEDYTPNN